MNQTQCLVCHKPLTVVSKIRVHPTCELDPQIVAGEVFGLLRDGILNQPRGKQRMIGPSEIGQPCGRRLGYRLGQVPKTQREDIKWKPFVGTALHEQVATLVATHEIARFGDGSDTTVSTRWLVEERVTVGEVNGIEITGSADLFDAHHGVVFDWKFVGETMLRKYKNEGPGQQYQWQAHLYGQGFINAGFDVRSVAVIFMTRDGDFTDRVVWAEPFNPDIAAKALERLTGVDDLLTELGTPAALELLDTAANYCKWCPWFRKESTNIATGCPGHENT